MTMASSTRVLRGLIFQEKSRAVPTPSERRSGSQGDVRAERGLPKPDTDAPLPSSGINLKAGYSSSREQGLAEGMRQGLLEAEARIEEASGQARRAAEKSVEKQRLQLEGEYRLRLTALDDVMHGLKSSFDGRLRELESEAIDLAFAAVCRLVGEKHAHADLIVGCIRAGIKTLGDRPLLRVRLNPMHLKVLSGTVEGTAVMQAHPGVDFIPDGRLTGGGCVLDTERGSLDATLQSQLAKLRESWSSSEDLGAQEG